ncbi:MAG TPA: type II CAAX endopeptidase family protein [Bryobacteraceae bacterium]|nr:type II CAAX endopeptidase family protein [Bryobacteraceae bacterium]
MIQLPEVPQPAWGWKEVVLSIALMLPAMIVGAILSYGAAWLLLGHAPSQVQIAIPSQMASYALWLGGVWAIFRGLHLKLWDAVAWTWPADGPWIYLAIGPVLALAAGLLASLLQAKDIKNGLMEQLLSDPWGCRLLVLFGITGAPLIEELLFRGILLPVAVRSLGIVQGLLITAVPFSLMHGPMYDWSWQHLLLLILVGIGFGLVRLRSQSTLAATITHGAYNLMMFAGHFVLNQ